VNRIRALLVRAVQLYGGPVEVVVDAHRYGGAALIAIGIGSVTASGIGYAIFGALLVWYSLPARPPRSR
jgi:hypothetical protein